MKGKLTARKAALLLSSMMTMMAGAVVAPALPQISEAFSHRPGYELLVRLIITLPALFIAVTAPIAGILCDRIGRKKVLNFGLVLYLIAGTAGFYLNELHSILFSRALLGIAVAAIMTSVTTLIGDYFNNKEREAFMGMQGAFIGIGGITFMSLAGILAGINWHWPFIIYAFSLPVLILVVRTIQDPENYGKKAEQANQESEVGPEPKTWLIYLIYFTGFIGIVFFYMVPVQVPYLLKDAGIDEKYIGMIISLMTLSSAIVSMNYRRFSRLLRFPTISGLAFVLMGLGYIAISYSHSGLHYSLSLLLAGTGIGLLMPTSNLWIMSVVAPARRGVFVGRLTMAVFLGQFMSPIFIQPLIKTSGVAEAFGTMSIVLIASGVVYVLIRKVAAPGQRQAETSVN